MKRMQIVLNIFYYIKQYIKHIYIYVCIFKYMFKCLSMQINLDSCKTKYWTCLRKLILVVIRRCNLSEHSII